MQKNKVRRFVAGREEANDLCLPYSMFGNHRNRSLEKVHEQTKSIEVK